VTTNPAPAPLTRRTPAFLIDQLVVLLLVVPPALLGSVSVQDLLSPGETRQIVFLILMAVAFVYHFLFEWLTGQTVGKIVFGLEVVGSDRRGLTMLESLLRNALRGIDGLGAWGVAVIVILVRGDGKRIGDVAADSLVVEKR
jgi:uncharacterized RDD family membrane protein YckC